MPLSALVVNGTFVVAAGKPAVYTPEQLDKLEVGPITAGLFPFVAGIGALLINAAWKRKGFSYAPLSTLWLWSITVVGFAVFAEYGRFTHFVDFIAILHVQIEWLIIGLLLRCSAETSAGLSAIAGVVMYTAMFALPGIRGTLLVTSVIGGFGDTFIPVLLFYGKQPLLGLGGVGHFISAYVTFRNFVQYIDVSLYLTLQFFGSVIHSVFTIAGIARLRRDEARIRLPDENGSSNKADQERQIDDPLIDIPLTGKTVAALALFSLVLSLAASLPINFAPRK